jgi:hypothetical protein
MLYRNIANHNDRLPIGSTDYIMKVSVDGSGNQFPSWHPITDVPAFYTVQTTVTQPIGQILYGTGTGCTSSTNLSFSTGNGFQSYAGTTTSNYARRCYDVSGNNLEAVRGSGIIDAPKQSRVGAYSDNGYPGTVVAFPSAQFDTQSEWNGSTHIFTATVDGYYMISFTDCGTYAGTGVGTHMKADEVASDQEPSNLYSIELLDASGSHIAYYWVAEAIVTYFDANTVKSLMATACVTRKLTAGQKIRVLRSNRFWTIYGTPTYTSDANSFSVNKLG